MLDRKKIWQNKKSQEIRGKNLVSKDKKKFEKSFVPGSILLIFFRISNISRNDVFSMQNN